MNFGKAFITFSLLLSTHSSLIGATAAAENITPELPSAEQYATQFAAHAPSVHTALVNTCIHGDILKAVLFPYLASYTPQFRFYDISRKLAATPDGNRFYAVNTSDDLLLYNCRAGTVTRLTRAPIPASCIRESSTPVKSWCVNSRLITIAFYTNFLRKIGSWHVSSTDLNPPFTTRFHKLNSEYYRRRPRPTAAALLGAGLVVCDKSEFALLNTNNFETLQTFNRPIGHRQGYALKRINGRQFVGQFNLPNFFCHYDVTQSAPLHSFTTAYLQPRIFPCHDERTAIVSDLEGTIIHCLYDGTVQTDYTKAWGRNDEPGITIMPDGESFVAAEKEKIAQFHFAHPGTPTVIDHKVIGLVRTFCALTPISSTTLLARRASPGVGIVHLDSNTTEILDPNITPLRIKATPQGFLLIEPGRINVWSKRSQIESAFKAGAATPRLDAAGPRT